MSELLSLYIDDTATDNNILNDVKPQISKLLYSPNMEHTVTWSEKDCLIIGWRPDKDEVGKLVPKTSYEVKENNQIKCVILSVSNENHVSFSWTDDKMCYNGMY